MNWEEHTVEELRDELRSRELKVSGDKEELVARLELDDAEREIDGETPEPEPEAPEEGDEDPSVDEDDAPVEPDAKQGIRISGNLPGYPGTHQPSNLDEAVRFRVLPDGRRVPLLVE